MERAATQQVRCCQYPKTIRHRDLTFDRGSVASSSTSSFAFPASLEGHFAGILVVSIRRGSGTGGRISELFDETAAHGLCVRTVLVAHLDGDLVPIDLLNFFSKSEKESGDGGVPQIQTTMRSQRGVSEEFTYRGEESAVEVFHHGGHERKLFVGK